MGAVTKISSSFTFVNKWLFPIVWFGFLAFFIGEAVLDGTVSTEPLFIFGPLFMAVIGFLVMRLLVWDLADAVYDCGDHLLVRKGGEEVRIDLKNVMNVSSTTMVNPPRVTLRLVKPSSLGSAISFSPKTNFSVNPFAKNPVAESLMERAYSARSKNAL